MGHEILTSALRLFGGWKSLGVNSKMSMPAVTDWKCMVLTLLVSLGEAFMAMPADDVSMAKGGAEY
ncbi:hypothetical protein ACJJIR_06245 [Microbulbifer sp. SSSA008]|uniref:hypothetical protein n=1 Tax=Microbulbifer sp. SSSA008 TaxID=3243380 RepID=UPI004039B308